MTTPGGQLTPGDEPEIGDPPQYGVPAGAYVGDAGSPQSFKDLNTLNKDEAKRRMQSQVAPSFAAQRDGFWGRIQDLLDVLGGGYAGTLPVFVDGQIALNGRFELLRSISGYGTAYMTKNYWMGSDGGGVLGERGREIPFRGYLGPHKNCELVTGMDGSAETGHWRLLAPGTWRADILVTTGNSPTARAEHIIEVCAPDGTPWHRKVSYMPSSGGDDVTVSVATTFVVPDAGYTVHARRTKPFGLAKSRVLGGTELSAFTVNRWDLDATDHVNAPTVPDGGDIG